MENKLPGKPVDESTQPAQSAQPAQPAQSTQPPPELEADDNLQTDFKFQTETENNSALESASITTNRLAIHGIGDRLHHLAMSHAAPKTALPQSQLERSDAVGKVRPTSRLECARSHGAKVLCNPSHPASCGGKYCGKHANARGGTDLI